MPTSPRPVTHLDTVDGARIPVSLQGPEHGRHVVIFDDPEQTTSWHEAVCRRLHVARLRTVLITADRRLTAKSAAGILDALQVRAAVLVGDQGGGALAWELAATYHDRFTGLVVIDAGHPRVADVNGVIRDERCPDVHADTTALVSSCAADAVARASRRCVHGEFRLRELAGWRGSRHFATQLVTEILLRRHTWPG
ncbi:alpha/beta hydrolase [Mycobacterium sp. SM1]|nr:alpha/beta hydrolase [Mycobacterium sp. SM1]